METICTHGLHTLSGPHYEGNYFIHIMHHSKLLIWGLHHIWLVHRHSWHPVNTSLLDLRASREKQEKSEFTKPHEIWILRRRRKEKNTLLHLLSF